MSCYICNADTIAMIADALADKLTKTINYSSFANDRAAFKDCFIHSHFIGDNGSFDTHRVYRKLYIENLKAYNGRYNENVREFTRYTPCKADSKLELHQALHEYLYQLAEDATDGRPIYNAVQHLMYTVADDIVISQWR